MSSSANPVPFSENTSLAKSRRLFDHPVEALPFAKLIPVNETARNAFHNAVQYIDEHPDLHLKQFIIVDESSVIHDSSEWSDDTTEYETDIDHGRLSKGQTFHGHFTLSFKTPPEYASTIGWRIGKGSSKTPKNSRGVEILLARPSQKEAKKIAVVHATIQVNADSGVFVLTAGSDKPIWYYSDNEETKLQRYAHRVLFQPSNKFRNGDCEYKIVFDVSDIITFVQDRNNYFTTVHNRAPPHSKLNPIPQPYHRKLGHAIIHNSLNSGAFGWIFIGVDFVTGHPLAVKELRIRRNDDLKSVENEVAISRRFIKNQTW